MEGSVNTVRYIFYQDLIDEYVHDGKESFLYRYFWADSVSGFLEEHFPGTRPKRTLRPEDEPGIKKMLAGVWKKNPGRTAGRLLKKASKGKRRNLWEELWLNDIGYLAGLIEDRDYYLWLVEYLAVNDNCYKDTSMWDLRIDLDYLLKAGLQDGERTPEPGSRKRKRKGAGGTEEVFITAQVKRDLADLAEKLRRERKAGGTEISGRLHDIVWRVGTGEDRRRVDYLLYLTGEFAQMALCARIKHWLQDGGYPVLKPKDGEHAEEDTEENAEEDAGKKYFREGSQRKRDFSMRMFEAYCSSPQGYEIRKKDPGGAAVQSGWHMKYDGFCMLDPDQIRTLQDALGKSQATSFHIPLAVDLYSGCVFFLAGKKLYEAVYRREVKKQKAAYEKAEKSGKELEERIQRDPDNIKTLRKDLADAERNRLAAMRKYRCAAEAWKTFMDSKNRFCFDFLRLDETHLKQFPGDVRGAFRLRPNFLENAGKSHESLLVDFMKYCGEEGGPRALVREFNQEQPAGIQDPDMFSWAFDS